MNIRFADEETHKRFCLMSVKTRGWENSLDKCIVHLAFWSPWNHDCVISRDFHDQSFFFQEKSPDGRNGMCGGIIFHGAHDNGGDGRAPTFSVNSDSCEGYLIHT